MAAPMHTRMTDSINIVGLTIAVWDAEEVYVIQESVYECVYADEAGVRSGNETSR